MTNMDNQAKEPGSSKVPLHRRIAENLSQQVSSGKLKQGERLPSERLIARQFHASRATVRTALQHLEQAGLIARRERRSAVVSIRRDITPFLRLACSNPRLVRLFGRLSEMQLLPPRCQLQLADLPTIGTLGHLATQPALRADVLICDLEYVKCFRGQQDYFSPVPRRQVADIPILPVLQDMLLEDDNFTAVPLGISPQVIFFNQAILNEAQLAPPADNWQWNDLREMALQLTHAGRYGFQFRPSFNHLSALMAGWGGQLYQADGRIAARSAEVFEPVIRYIYDLLHIHKVTPLLAKGETLNLFAARRCALALDGFEQYGLYHEKLGENLRIGPLPRSIGGFQIPSGYALVVLGKPSESQPVLDLIRMLLSVGTQRMLTQVSAALPVRVDLQNGQTLQDHDLSSEFAETFLKELRHCKPVNLPSLAEHKHAVEELFLELWLGLDNVESLCHRFREL